GFALPRRGQTYQPRATPGELSDDSYKALKGRHNRRDKQTVEPFQGRGLLLPRAPRAMPGAGMFGPFGAGQCRWRKILYGVACKGRSPWAATPGERAFQARNLVAPKIPRPPAWADRTSPSGSNRLT